MLSQAQRARLVALARGAITAAVAARSSDHVGRRGDLPPASGVFVTVRHRGILRGCLGTVAGDVRLRDEVVRCARDAATRDVRFVPVAIDELDELTVEISVLGPLEAIGPDPDAFTLGVHGLVVEADRHRGLLLPQVAVEWAWTAEEFLCRTSIKAGLPPDAWRRGARVYRFAAEVFGD
jgi:AmmeMemoRadiSam system protein A